VIQVTRALSARRARARRPTCPSGPVPDPDPYRRRCGISRKIEDPQERKRLEAAHQRAPRSRREWGVIVRTAGEGKKPRYFVRDLHLLLKKWEEVTRKIQSDRAPACLYMEPDVVERTVRDFLTEDVDRVLIDNKADYDRTQDLVGLISKRSRSKIAYYQDSIPIFERSNIDAPDRADRSAQGAASRAAARSSSTRPRP